MIDSSACYSCSKPGHMMKGCPNRRIQEQGKERFQPNVPSEKAPRSQRFFILKCGVQGKALLVKSRVSIRN